MESNEAFARVQKAAEANVDVFLYVCTLHPVPTACVESNEVFARERKAVPTACVESNEVFARVRKAAEASA